MFTQKRFSNINLNHLNINLRLIIQQKTTKQINMFHFINVFENK